jgi:carboxylate-amine ligase
VSKSAGEHGAELAALATSPVPVDPEVFPSLRYRRMAQRFGMAAQEQLTCGTHIHVAITSEEEGVGVLDRIRPWLAVLLALSGNSPYWQGEDSSYASYRAQVWSRWPSAGPTELFGSAQAYQHTVRALVDSETILDEGMIYFDARLARNYPTVELRVPDVCMHAQDAALLAVLARALVETAAREWAAGRSAPLMRTEALKLASWRASRSGLEGALIHPHTQRPAPAHEVVRALVDHVQPGLEHSCEAEEVRGLLEDLLGRGNGASLQRAACGRNGRLVDVVTDAITRTRAA